MVHVHCLLFALLGLAVPSWGLPSSFMLVSGVTSSQEMCLVGVKEVGVIVDACENAISKLDGREIWSLAPDGSLTSTGSSKCLGAKQIQNGAGLELLPCDANKARWELEGNGQIKLASSTMCLTLSGLGPGLTDVARSASVLASSTLDVAHGAVLAVDGLASTFWVSKLGETEPVSLTVLIDEAVPVVEADLEFEFVPSSFAVQISIDGRSWTEVFATDANILKKVRVPLATDKAYGVKLLMMKAHATHGVLGGKSLYGVRSFKVLSPGMRATVGPCATVGASSDARDKYFPVAVGSFDPAAGAKLSSDSAAVEAAGAALSTAVVGVSEATSKMCGTASLKSVMHARRAISSKLTAMMDAQQSKALLAEAKHEIVAARSALQK